MAEQVWWLNVRLGFGGTLGFGEGLGFGADHISVEKCFPYFCSGTGSVIFRVPKIALYTSDNLFCHKVTWVLVQVFQEHLIFYCLNLCLIYIKHVGFKNSC